MKSRARSTTMLFVMSFVVVSCSSGSHRAAQQKLGCLRNINVSRRCAGTWRPADLKKVTRVSLPLDDGTADPFSVKLFAAPDGTKYGVFRATTVDAGASEGCTEPNQLGPNGMVGATRQVGPETLRFAARDRSLVKELCETYPKAPRGTKAIATADPSPIPGMGSLPLAYESHAYLTSYVSVGAAEQRSVAIGVTADIPHYLDMLAWWSGEQLTPKMGGHEVVIDSYAVDDGETPPKAHLYVFQTHGNLMLVRTAGLSETEQDRVLNGLTSTSS